MKHFLLLATLLWAPHKILAQGMFGVKISYEDLKRMNASCYPRDTCLVQRLRDSPEILPSYSCSCDRHCFQLGTCCIDSPHRDYASPTVKPVCRAVGETHSSRGYYMVDRCPNDGSAKSDWRNLCDEEWNGEDDIKKVAPVTSLETSTTYKNYYCFRCHEITENFLYWNLRLQPNHYKESEVRLQNNVSMTYNRANNTWTAKVGETVVHFPTGLQFVIPDEIKSLLFKCDPDVISRCSDTWSDENTQDKCSDYAAIIYVRNIDGSALKYKNVHCALCNFESLNSMVCDDNYVHGLRRKRNAPKPKFVRYRSNETYIPQVVHVLGAETLVPAKQCSQCETFGSSKQCSECPNNCQWDETRDKCLELHCWNGMVIRDGKCTNP